MADRYFEKFVVLLETIGWHLERIADVAEREYIAKRENEEFKARCWRCGCRLVAKESEKCPVCNTIPREEEIEDDVRPGEEAWQFDVR